MELNNFQRLNRIVERHQYDHFCFGGQKVLVDAQTANLLVKVYRELSKSNQEKFRRMLESKTAFLRLVDFCWSVVK